MDIDPYNVKYSNLEESGGTNVAVHYYVGFTVNGKKSGFGRLYERWIGEQSKKLIYEGNFVNGKKEGWGQSFYHHNNGLLYEGNFNKGLMHGNCQYMYNEYGNLLYYGNFVRGILNGFGIQFHKNGKVKCRGMFFDGKFQGDFVKTTFSNGQIKDICMIKQGNRNQFYRKLNRSGKLLKSRNPKKPKQK